MDRASITTGYSTPISELKDVDPRLFEESPNPPANPEHFLAINQAARTYRENVQKKAESQAEASVGGQLTTRDLLGTMLILALRKKEACVDADALADAERECMLSECLIRQFLGGAVVEEVKREYEAGVRFPIDGCVDTVGKLYMLGFFATPFSSPPN